MRHEVEEAEVHTSGAGAALSGRAHGVLEAALDGKGVLERVAGGRVDVVAVQVGDRLAEVDGYDDEGGQQERVDRCHDEEADIGGCPVEGDGDESVEGRNAGLRVC